MAANRDRGCNARKPSDIPAKGWWDILKRVKSEISSDHVSVVAAGVAFFGLLAIFPAIAAVISIAGFFLDPADVAGQLDSLATLLPESAASIIQSQITAVTGGDETATGLAALFGILIALGVILILPVVLNVVPLPDVVKAIISWAQWPVLAVLTMFGLAVVYRFGPARENAEWRWVSPGAVVATILWLAGTVAFSIYAQNFGSYNETYGTIGGVIILLTWLWISAYIVLAGAELNSEMEHQTRKDTTTGPELPQGQRGAIKADTNPDELQTSGKRNHRYDDAVISRRPSLLSAAFGLLALRIMSSKTARK